LIHRNEKLVLGEKPGEKTKRQKLNLDDDVQVTCVFLRKNERFFVQSRFMNILTCDAEGQFHVVEQSAAKLEELKDPCHIVCVSGAERCGKSTISTVLSGFSTFPSQIGTVPHTKAVWVAVRPNEQGVLIFDFEGFSTNPSHNMKLMVLSIMLSHVIVFNSPCNIRVEDLDVIECASEQTQSLGSDLAQPPALLWLLRNFSLEANLNQGNYFRRFVMERDGSRIMNYFSQIACIGVPIPDQIIPPGSRTLAPSMQAAEEMLRSQIFSMTQRMQRLCGPDIVLLLRAVCSALNTSGSQLNIGSAWQERQAGLARTRRIERLHEIENVCRSQLQDLSPTAWRQAVHKNFSPEDLEDFDDFLSAERQRVSQLWAQKTERVLNTVDRILGECQSLEQVAEFIQNVVNTFEPKELVQLATARLLPQLAKKIAVACEQYQSLLENSKSEIADLQNRLVQGEQGSAERSRNFRCRLEEIQKTLAEQHATELEFKSQELQQTQAQCVALGNQLQTQSSEFTQALAQLFDTQKLLEEANLAKSQVEEKLQEETTSNVSLKRKLAETDDNHAQLTKRMRDEAAAELKESKSREVKLSGQLQALQEQLEATLHEKEHETRRVQELEISRQNLNADNIRLRNEQFQKPQSSAADIKLRARVEALEKQNKRLKESAL
jgi:hypothetical protein